MNSEEMLTADLPVTGSDIVIRLSPSVYREHGLKSRSFMDACATRNS